MSGRPLQPLGGLQLSRNFLAIGMGFLKAKCVWLWNVQLQHHLKQVLCAGFVFPSSLSLLRCLFLYMLPSSLPSPAATGNRRRGQAKDVAGSPQLGSCTWVAQVKWSLICDLRTTQISGPACMTRRAFSGSAPPPSYQNGPRKGGSKIASSLLSGQATAPGQTSLSCGRKFSKTIIFATWNVRTLLDRENTNRPQR